MSCQEKLPLNIAEIRLYTYQYVRIIFIFYGLVGTVIPLLWDESHDPVCCHDFFFVGIHYDS